MQIFEDVLFFFVRVELTFFFIDTGAFASQESEIAWIFVVYPDNEQSWDDFITTLCFFPSTHAKPVNISEREMKI